MKNLNAADLMVSLDEYPVIDEMATVLDAVLRLEECRRNMDPGRQPFQAVLVADSMGNIVGKLGQLAILKALDPESQLHLDQDTLEKAGVSNTLFEMALDHFRSLQGEFSDMCEGAMAVPVSKVMRPLVEHIDIRASIREVIHSLVEWKTLSVLVTENGRPVGLVRLSDVCDAVISEMRRKASERTRGD